MRVIPEDKVYKQPVSDGMIPIVIPLVLKVPFSEANEEWADRFIEKINSGKIDVKFLENECK